MIESVGRAETVELDGHAEHRGTLLVSVHEFGQMGATALMTIISGEIGGNRQKQAEAHGRTPQEALHHALDMLFG